MLLYTRYGPQADQSRHHRGTRTHAAIATYAAIRRRSRRTIAADCAGHGGDKLEAGLRWKRIAVSPCLSPTHPRAAAPARHRPTGDRLNALAIARGPTARDADAIVSSICPRDRKRGIAIARLVPRPTRKQSRGSCHDATTGVIEMSPNR